MVLTVFGFLWGGQNNHVQLFVYFKIFIIAVCVVSFVLSYYIYTNILVRFSNK